MSKIAQNIFAITLAVLVAGASMTAVVTVPDAGHGAGAMLTTHELA